MNLLNKKLIKYKNNAIKITHANNTLKIKNPSDSHGFLIYPYIFNNKNKKSISMNFLGEVIKGNGAILQILDFNRNILSETSFNSSSNYIINAKKFFFCIKINRQSEVIINNINIEFEKNLVDNFNHILNSKNDILIITPSYPTQENKYFGGFVHSRVKAYKDSGIKFDLVCAHEYPNTCTYNFEGIDVTRTSFFGLRQILTQKKYKTILLHFFDNRYAQILDACDLSSTNLYFWIHGPETLYWDWAKMTDKYFTNETPLSDLSLDFFKSSDKLIKRYNNYPNVHWVFVSSWIKEKSEKLINIKFNNYVIIPNYIDEKNFNYSPKSPELRKKIFFLRRFENINKYAIDVNVRTILELSRRDFFNDLEFNIYGTGDFYDTLIAPIKDFPNVHLYPQFLTHEEIAKVHKENGIGLFATRYDAQGVSMCEAAMSGLTIVSSQNDAIAEFIPSDDILLCETEDYIQYANVIEKMYRNPDLFTKLSKKCHDKVFSKCSFEKTIQKEIDIIKNSNDFLNSSQPFALTNNKILSIIIPSYNVENYLFHGVYTILEHANGNKIEVIIVNDGSKDNTLSIAQQLQKQYSKSNVVIIDKPNGGHGSTINAGLKIATGKYIRIIDGDDWVDSNDMKKLIDILEKETSDIVLTNYSEDRAVENQLIPKTIYEFMKHEKQYKFDDLCYEGYGFTEWGPILATANFKNEVLKNSFVLTENCFYIDMEFDAYSIEKAETITYYPLNIYRYFIGRIDQSISQDSYTRNFKQHEKVLFNLINYYTNSEISTNKKNYILNKLIIPMLVAHYTILVQFLKSRKEYNIFEKKLKKYPNLYNDPRIATKMKKFHRKTHGIFIKYTNLIKKLSSKIFN